MKVFFSFIFLVQIFTALAGQTELNIQELGHLKYQQTLSDLWAFTDSSGNEWAIVGVKNGESVVSLQDPKNPQEKFFLPGASSDWRDIKFYNGYAYSVNEWSGGLRILDLRDVEDSVLSVKDTMIKGFASAHNLFIDEKGFLYICGPNVSNGGLLILDLNNDPWNPAYAGDYPQAYIHDIYVQNDTAWSCAVFDGKMLGLDVSNKSAVSKFTEFASLDQLTHNCWTDDSGKYLFITDEVNGSSLQCYDISDHQNPVLVEQAWSQISNEQSAPHNAVFHNNKLYLSHYHDGLLIYDASDPAGLIEIAWFDSSPLSGPGIGRGCWGVYPFLPSGNILITDVNEGLFVLKQDSVQVTRLSGTVRDSISSLPVSGTQILVNGKYENDFSGQDGYYSSGSLQSGLKEITWQKFGYYPVRYNVNFISGQTIQQDIKLSPASVQNYRLKLLDESGNPLPNVQLKLENSGVILLDSTDSGGEVFFKNIMGGNWTVLAGKWGFETRDSSLEIYPGDTSGSMILSRAYYDDFSFDLGWKIKGNATSGMWEMGSPEEVSWKGSIFTPGFDVVQDFDNACYITGNEGTYPGFDVDGGFTELESPLMDLSNFQDPAISFSYWFVNTGTASAADSFRVYLDNGNVEKEVFSTCCIHNPVWQSVTIRVKDFMTPGPQMKIRVSVSDRNINHVVEAGFDLFRAGELKTVHREDEPQAQLFIYPNPSDEFFRIYGIPEGKSEIDIFNMTGQHLLHAKINQLENIRHNLKAGMYLVRIKTRYGQESRRLLIR